MLVQHLVDNALLVPRTPGLLPCAMKCALHTMPAVLTVNNALISSCFARAIAGTIWRICTSRVAHRVSYASCTGTPSNPF